MRSYWLVNIMASRKRGESRTISSKVIAFLMLLFLLSPIATANATGLIKDGNTYTFFDLPGAIQTEFLDINDTGTVLGRYVVSHPDGHYFLKNGETITLVDYPGALKTWAYAINDYGTVVGYYVTALGASGEEHAFEMKDNIYTTFDYPTAAGNHWTRPYGINDAGVIVGEYSEKFHPLEEYARAFEKNGNDYTSFVHSGAYWTHPYDINDVGTIVGAYTEKDCSSNCTHNFVKDGDIFFSIEYPSAYSTSLLAIADDGTILGNFRHFGYEASDHYFLWNAGEFNLIDYPDGIGNCRFTGMNDEGVLVGTTFIPAPPVPEPSTLLLLAAGLFAFVGVRQRIGLLSR